MDINNNKLINNQLINLNVLYEKLCKNLIDLNEIRDLNYVNDCGISLLLLASIDGNLNLIKKMIENNKIVYTDCYRLLGTNSDPLHMAVKFEHFDLVKYLIEEKKVYLNINDSYSCTPLYYSIEKGNCDLFNYLIEMGADLNLIKENKFKLAINSLNNKFINLILPYLNEHDLNYCPFSDLSYSYCYPLDFKKRLICFNYLLRHPLIKIKQHTNNKYNLNDLVKMNKFRFLKLLILNNYDLDRLNLDFIFIKNLNDKSYCNKLLIVLKLVYYLGFKYLNLNLDKLSNIQLIDQSNNFNTQNAFFGHLNDNDDQNLIPIQQTQIFQIFLNWKSKKCKLHNLQQLSRIALRKHFNKNLIPILDQINYPNYLLDYLNLDDLNNYLDVLDT